MTTKATMTDVAFDVMQQLKQEVEFSKLWQEVSKVLDIPADKLSRKKAQFYSELMLDNRFASFKGNMWDLKSRRKFEEFHKATDINDMDDDDELETEIQDDDEEVRKDEEDY